MLFNPLSNIHYLMFQMGDASSGGPYTTDFDLVVPDGSVVTRSDDPAGGGSSELTVTGTTGRGD